MTDTDYTEIEACYLGGACGNDAMKWAIAFVQHMKKSDFVIDEDLIIGWFANAMAQSEPKHLTEE